ncbi:TIR domain-containing protein [Aeromonas bivalvium]|uniref:TIR domain-containing protein n=1 Tax=Aeromonas bivalvium TaxID=440079 RepID=UPI0038D09B49
MKKVFLSHSSMDKAFVRAVYYSLGAARAVFDEATFDHSGYIVSEIETHLRECSIFCIFLSSNAIQSSWVKGELNRARELMAEGKLSKLIIFRLDDTEYKELDPWTHSYLAMITRNPRQAVIRIKSTLLSDHLDDVCYGRDGIIKKINSDILENLDCNFIHISAPDQMGRKTVVSNSYKQLFKSKYLQSIKINVDGFGDITSLFLELLPYTDNWTIQAQTEQFELFNKLSNTEQYDKVISTIVGIKKQYQSYLCIDIGRYAINEHGALVDWLEQLVQKLPNEDYPYIIFISNKPCTKQYKNGLSIKLDPLNESDSKYMFKMLMHERNISLPKGFDINQIIENIVGHPGLIKITVNYLNRNIEYRASRLVTNVSHEINGEVERIYNNFVNIQPSKKQYYDITLSICSEAGLLSDEDVSLISEGMPYFEDCIYDLIDCGMIYYEDGYYQLPSYLDRHAQRIKISNKSDDVRSAMRTLLSSIEDATEDAIIPSKTLSSRIVDYLMHSGEVPKLITKLVIPSQRLKAARKLYNEEKYDKSLKISHDLCNELSKLSSEGALEAWRILGLSAARLQNKEEIDAFNSIKDDIPNVGAKTATVNFVNGFYEKHTGNIKKAYSHFLKSNQIAPRDIHSLRELSFIFCFNEDYSQAEAYISKALSISPNNPYLLDISALTNIMLYKNGNRSSEQLRKILSILDKLKDAEEREGKKFYKQRKQTFDVIINSDMASLNEAYTNRRILSVAAQLTLLELLHIKNKTDMFDVLRKEIDMKLKQEKNNIARIELIRLSVLQKAYLEPEQAIEILNQNTHRLTDEFHSSVLRKIEQTKAIRHPR